MGSWVLELLGGWGNIVNGYSGLSCASPTIYPPGMCVLVFKTFLSFDVNVVNISKHNPLTQKLLVLLQPYRGHKTKRLVSLWLRLIAAKGYTAVKVAAQH